MNKIKGQADANRPRRANNAEAKSGNEEYAPKITLDALSAFKADWENRAHLMEALGLISPVAANILSPSKTVRERAP